MAMHLTCNQDTEGSSPSHSSNTSTCVRAAKEKDCKSLKSQVRVLSRAQIEINKKVKNKNEIEEIYYHTASGGNNCSIDTPPNSM